jgi:curved DNA-binding protein CbpA
MTTDRSDPYAVLGLTSRATQAEIRRAFHRLMRQNHPDTRAIGEPAASAVSDTTLQQAIAAYSILGDPARRAHYDHPATPTAPTRPTRIRTVLSFQRRGSNQPPILAGPVRWHSGT